MDLGLAQLADESEGRLTRTRQFVGTLRYASPEQVLSVPLDRRSDVYSLGATLWELLTLRPLFGATEQTPTHELMLKIQSTDPDPPAAAQPAGARGSGSDRAQVPGEGPGPALRHGLRAGRRPSRWLRGEPVQAQPPTLGYLLGKSLRRHRVGVALVSLSIVVLMAVIVAGSFGVYSGRLQRAYASESAARELSVIAQGETRFIRRKRRRG